jgi:hypothetical protein
MDVWRTLIWCSDNGIALRLPISEWFSVGGPTLPIVERKGLPLARHFLLPEAL